MKRMYAIALVGLGLIARPARAAPAEAPSTLALIGGEVRTVSGATIPGGTVLIRGSKIVAVGKVVSVPPSATKIDCAGKVVTPGLVESDSAMGLVEVAAEPSTVDSAPAWPDPVRAAVNAADGVDLRSTLVGVARRQGITSAVSAPTGGLISGRSAWLDLVSPDSRHLESAVRSSVAMTVHFGSRGAAAVGASRATALMRFREVLEDARVFKNERGAFQRNAVYKLATSRLDLAALEPVVAGDMRVVIEVKRASDILAALELARRERLRVALLGAEEGWLVAEAIAEAKVPVIVDPFANLPDSFEERSSRADNAALLAQKGVKIALSTRSSHNAGWLRFGLGNAVRAGLSADLALEAATLAPAEIFGVKGEHGSLEPGKQADVVVWTGDPFEPSTYAETVIIRGEIQPVESRQTRLAERYIRRHGLDVRGRRAPE